MPVKRGRPKGTKLTEQIHVRCTAAQKRDIERAADKMGMPLASLRLLMVERSRARGEK